MEGLTNDQYKIYKYHDDLRNKYPDIENNPDNLAGYKEWLRVYYPAEKGARDTVLAIVENPVPPAIVVEEKPPKVITEIKVDIPQTPTVQEIKIDDSTDVKEKETTGKKIIIDDDDASDDKDDKPKDVVKTYTEAQLKKNSPTKLLKIAKEDFGLKATKRWKKPTLIKKILESQ